MSFEFSFNGSQIRLKRHFGWHTSDDVVCRLDIDDLKTRQGSVSDIDPCVSMTDE